MTGVDMIAAERERQIEAEGWTPAHDDEHDDDQLALAAACYARPHTKRLPKLWPWDTEWWRPTPKNRIRELVKAGALIAAEIDRLTRSAPPAAPLPAGEMKDE